MVYTHSHPPFHPLPSAATTAAADTHTNGISQISFMIVANLAGAGILSLPKAINGAGITGGAILIIAAALLSGYTADILCRCYNIIHAKQVEDEGETALLNDVEIRVAPSPATAPSAASLSANAGDDADGLAFLARSPYAAIAQRAAGTLGVYAVTVAQVLTQFAVIVVFFLLSGKNIHKLSPSHSALFYSLVCSAALTPLFLLKPGHVWITAFLAVLCSLILVVVVIVLSASDAPHDPYTPPPQVSFSSFGTAFGVILFGFGGHAILPSLMATMTDPTPARFRKAITASNTVVTGMYLSTGLCAVLTLGGTVSDDILTNFGTSVLNSFGLVSVTAHLLFAAITVHIPRESM